MKRTTETRLQYLEENVSNVRVVSGTVWTPEELALVIEKYSRYGEMIKIEITHSLNSSAGTGHEYRYIMWHNHLLNQELRHGA